MSEEQDQSSKTEEPSERKLEEAREKGQTFYSKEMGSFLSLLTFAIILGWAGRYIGNMYLEIALPLFSGDTTLDLKTLREIILQVLLLLLLPSSFLLIINILSSIMQHGIICAPDVIKPDLSRISIFSGLKRIFSLNSVVELVKGIFKISLIGAAIYMVIEPDFLTFCNSYKLEVGDLMLLVLKALNKIMLIVCIITFLLGIGDYFYQRQAYNTKMRMTKQEVKDEYKRQEGHPEVKAKLKAMRLERAKSRMMAAVPKADVIITNPTHYAIALQYKDTEMDAPIIIAKGQDEIALEIKRIAEEHKIPIVENATLARSLYSMVNIGEAIKYEHYQAVAEVIAYVMKLGKKKRPLKK